MYPETLSQMAIAPHILVETSMPPFRKILVPVDGSNTSNKALDHALDMARESKAQVRLVHCIDELSLLNSHEYPGEMFQLVRTGGENILKEGLSAAKGLGVDADTRLIDRVGQRLGESVAEAAIDFSADLVVVGTHGRRGIGRVLLGSGCEQIIRMSPVPVLVVRGTD
jgi:nucleotide-binding universal stress UspA family protein